MSLEMFNVVVENIIRTCMAMPVDNHRVDPDGLGETFGQCLGVFYADYDMVGSRESEWLQHAMNVLVGLLRRYGLAAKFSKSRTMTCQTGALRAGMSEEAMALKFMGVEDLYLLRLQ